jgi:hypothetical protein
MAGRPCDRSGGPTSPANHLTLPSPRSESVRRLTHDGPLPLKGGEGLLLQAWPNFC